MKNTIRKVSVGLLTIIMLFSVNANYYFASALRALTMSPMRQRIVLNPGEIYEGSFSVSNPQTSDEDFNYTVEVGSYSVSKKEGENDDYGEMNFEASLASNYNMIMDWITLENPTGVLAPGASENILYTINVPSDAPAGGQYASLLVTETRNIDAKEGSIGVVEKMQMAHIIYAEITGETLRIGNITENSLPSFMLNNKLDATSMVRNEGNVHTDAEYVLQVWPLFSDEEVCTNEEEPDTSLVLPNTERYHTQSCSLPPVGIFRAKQVVKIFDEVSELEKTIVVCPLWLLFLIVFVVVALIIWLVVKAKGRKTSRK